MDAQTPETPPASGVGTGVPLPREAADPGALTPLVPTGPPPVSLKRSRWRVVIAGILAIVPLLCIAGIAIAFHEYDKATRPDRSNPQNALNNYLIALLDDRDSAKAASFQCADANGLAAFKQFIADADSTAAAVGQSVTFTWLYLSVTQVQNEASIAVSIIQKTFDRSTQVGRSTHDWLFDLNVASDWRVCSAAPIQ